MKKILTSDYVIKKHPVFVSYKNEDEVAGYKKVAEPVIPAGMYPATFQYFLGLVADTARELGLDPNIVVNAIVADEFHPDADKVVERFWETYEVAKLIPDVPEEIKAKEIKVYVKKAAG